MLNSGVPQVSRMACPGWKTPQLPTSSSPRWTASFLAMSTSLDAYWSQLSSALSYRLSFWEMGQLDLFEWKRGNVFTSFVSHAVDSDTHIRTHKLTHTHTHTHATLALPTPGSPSSVSHAVDSDTHTHAHKDTNTYTHAGTFLLRFLHLVVLHLCVPCCRQQHTQKHAHKDIHTYTHACTYLLRCLHLVVHHLCVPCCRQRVHNSRGACKHALQAKDFVLWQLLHAVKGYGRLLSGHFWWLVLQIA